MKTNLKIEMVSTGDEVLYGQINDTNATWLSAYLFEQGYLITTRYTIGDNLPQLIDTLQQRSQVNDVLIVNGGLGPTSDDLTAEAAAQANGETLILFPHWLSKIEHYFAKRGKTMPLSNIKQAQLPKSAIIIDNPIGTACGFQMIINQCHVYFTPGVPIEFKQMVSEQILPDLQRRFPCSNKPLCYRLTTMGRSESDLADQITSTLIIPEGITIGYRSAMPIIELKLTANKELQSAMDQLWHQLKILVKDNIIYEGTIGLAALVSQLLQQHQQKLVILEQVTAGLMAYSLYNCKAPLIHSQVLTTHQDVISTVEQLKASYPKALILSLYDYDEETDQFKLQLSTDQVSFDYHLKYCGRRYNKSIQQTILINIGYDVLRRYLLNLPLIGNYAWLAIEHATVHNL